MKFLLVMAGLAFALVTCKEDASADAARASRAFDSGDYESAIVHSTFAILKDSTFMDMYALRGMFQPPNLPDTFMVAKP
jgi:hypothetical protein